MALRSSGADSLVEMARNGHDDQASRILCEVAAKQHAPKDYPPPSTVLPLSRWFEALGPAASRFGGAWRRAAATARELLACPQEVVVIVCEQQARKIPINSAKIVENISAAKGRLNKHS